MKRTSKEIEHEIGESEKQGKWERAFQLWEERATHSSLAPRQLFSFAQSAAYSGRLDRAASLLAQAGTGHLAAGQIAMLKADISERRGDFESALHWRREAAREKPDGYWIRYGIARAMNGLKTYTAQEMLAEMLPALKAPEAERQGGMFAARLFVRAGDLAAANDLANKFLPTEGEREIWAINALPGMTSEKERATARELALNATGNGMIVDLGCWMGSLTAALASGLKANRNKAKPPKVIAFDKFEWVGSYMEASWPGSKFGLHDDDDYLPWFRRFTARWRDFIDVRKIDLEDTTWNEGRIEILIVDAMKTERLAQTIIAAFFPSLLPDAFVFHQDFCHHHTWWIHLYHFKMRHKFRVVDTVRGSGTVVFQLVQPFTAEELSVLLTTDLSDPVLAADAFDYSLSLIEPIDHREVLMAYARCERQNNRAENASRIEMRLASQQVLSPATM